MRFPLIVVLLVATLATCQDDIDEVMQIKKETFDEVTGRPLLGTFIMYYAPWCGHCKRMHSTWLDLAKKHNPQKNYLIAKVDCTTETDLCSEHDVLGYPTFLFYKPGSIAGITYDGVREFDSLEQFMYNYLDAEEAKIDQELEGPVYELGEENFDRFVAQGFAFVKFYAPWCGHCKTLAPLWEELGLKYSPSQVKICKVDCTVHRELCKQHQIQGYPTLLFFHNGQMIQKYKEQRTLEILSGFVDTLVESLATPAEHQQHQKVTTTDEIADRPLYQEAASVGYVAELNNDNFATALTKPGLLFVKFYAPWCGHCQKLVPIWTELAKKFETNVKVSIADVDCTASVELCMNNNVNYYPTLVLFRNGNRFKEFTTARDLESLIHFVEENLKIHEEL